jgi:tape measure domain-containing protein
MADLKKIGVQMMVKGASQFARDIGHVAIAFVHYGKAVMNAQAANAKLAQQQVNQLQKAMTQNTNLINRLTTAYANQDTRVKILRSNYNALTGSIAAHKAALATMNNTTAAYQQGMAALIKEKARRRNILKQIHAGVAKLNTIQNSLNNAQNQSISITQNLANAQATLTNILSNQMSIGGVLGSVWSALTGQLGRALYTGASLGATFARLALQISAVVMVVDVLKFAINAATGVIGVVITALGGLFSIFTKIVSVAFNVGKTIIGWVVNGLKQLVSIPYNFIVGGLRGIWESIKRIGEIAIGMNLSNLIWNLGTKLKDLGMMAVNAASDFQLLRIRMVGLIQRELAETKNIPFTDSLAEASEKAEELIGWVSQLAVKSKFGADEIANIFTLSMAYDMTAKEAQELTIATVNFATGMGLGNEQITRIVENFGQMKAAGKITGTELRDLARGAFMPINRVLEIMGENLGLDVEKTKNLRKELMDMSANGTANADDFFKAFIKLSGRDFPDAIGKASKSLQTVISNTEDFIKSVIGWRVITPTLDIISDRMSNFVEKLMTPEVIGLSKTVGEFFANMANGIFRASDSLTPSFMNRIDKFASTFDNILNAVMRFGASNNSKETSASLREIYVNLVNLGMNGKVANKLKGFLAGIGWEISNFGNIPIGESLKNLWKNISGAFSLLYDTYIKDELEAQWKKLQDGIPAVWENHIKPGLVTLWGLFTGWFETVWKEFPTFWANTVSPKLTEAITFLSDFIYQSDLGNEFGGAVMTKIVEFFTTTAGPAGQFAGQIATVLGSVLKIAFASAIQFAFGAGETLEDNSRLVAGKDTVFSPLEKSIESLGSVADEALDNSLRDLSEWFKSFLDEHPRIKTMADTIDLLGDNLALMASVTEKITQLLSGKEGEGGGFLQQLDKLIGPSSWINKIHDDLVVWKTELTILDDVLGLFTTVKDKLSGTDLTIDLGGGIGEIINSIITTGTKIATAFAEGFADAKASTITFKDEELGIFEDLDEAVVTHSIVPDMMTAIYESITTKFAEILIYTRDEFVTPFKAAFTDIDWYLMATTEMAEFFKGLQDAAPGILAWFYDFASKFRINVTYGFNGSGLPSPSNNPATNPTNTPVHTPVSTPVNPSGSQNPLDPGSVVTSSSSSFATLRPVVHNNNVTSVKENNYNLNVNSTLTTDNIVRQFGVMRLITED